METILNENLVKEMMPTILKSLAKFAYVNRLARGAEDMIRGEAFTLIRRHLTHLTQTHIGITKSNIERVYIDYETGEIQWFNFVKTYGGCYKENIIIKLNNLVEEISPNYKTLALSVELHQISEKIKKHQILKQ